MLAETACLKDVMVLAQVSIGVSYRKLGQSFFLPRSGTIAKHACWLLLAPTAEIELLGFCMTVFCFLTSELFKFGASLTGIRLLTLPSATNAAQ